VSRGRRVAWIALLLVAAAARLAELDARPPHHDEAVHGHFAHILAFQGAYRYDPTYHGPLLFLVTAAIFRVAGENLLTLRLYPAVAGIALVALPLALRRRVGERAALWCATLLAVSPSLLYYARFARNDVPVALFTAAAAALALRVRDRGARLVPWIGVALALHAVSKETIYVTAPLLAAGAAAVALGGGVGDSLRAAWSWVRRHRARCATAVLWFLALTVTAYTFVFIHPEDALFPAKAVRYWYEQHSIERVGGPWYYHLPRLALYEGLIVGAGLLWLVARRRPLRRWELFCAGWGLAGLAMYAYLGEKVPWLEVHQVLPFVPLAGAALARTFSAAGRWWWRGLAALGLAATAWSAVAVAYLHPTITPGDPHAELLVFVQTTPEAQRLAERGREVAAAGGTEPRVSVSGEASWPLSWQWQGLPVWWGLPGEGQRPLLVVCDPQERAAVEAGLGAGYRGREIPLRAWWVESWRGVGPVEVLRWFVSRRAWSDVGATEITVLEREPGRDGEDGGGK